MYDRKCRRPGCERPRHVRAHEKRTPSPTCGMPCHHWIKAAGVFHIGGAALGRDADTDRELFAMVARRLNESKHLPRREMEVLIELFDAYARA